MGDLHEAELARLRAVEEAAGLADDLLRRLSEWDMLWPGPPPVTADGPIPKKGER